MKITLRSTPTLRNLKLALAGFWIAGALVLGGSGRVQGQEKLISASAVHPPEWLARTPVSKEGLLFFVGIHSGAPVLEKGRDGAITDAASQIAAELGITISTQWVSEKTNLVTQLIDDVRIHSKAKVSGQRVRDIYWELQKPLKGKDPVYTVWVLVAYPEMELRKEKERLQGVQAQYAVTLRQLCERVAAQAKVKHLQTVQVTGFRELVTEKRYSFSRVLESDLVTHLVRLGVETVAFRSESLLTGSYRDQGGEVLISVRLEDGRGVSQFAETVTVPRESLSPEWLKVELPAQEPFFAGLEKPKPDLAQTGSLEVISTPQGARVYLDAQDRGAANVTLHDIPPGLHSVTLIFSGYEDYTDQVNVSANSTAYFSAELKRRRGAVEINTTPHGATVRIDGKPLARKTPAFIDDLLEGTHTLELTLENFKTHRHNIEIPFKDTLKLQIDLTEEDGSLLVNASPAEGKVYLGDQWLGSVKPQHPFASQSVPAGKQWLKIDMEGYEPWREEITIRPRQTTVRTVALKKAEKGKLEVNVQGTETSVYVDGGYAGLAHWSAPLTIDDLSVGKKTITVKKSGRNDWEGNVVIHGGKTEKLNVQLRETRPPWKFNSGFRSMILPGWGQTQNGQESKGNWMAVAFGGCVGAGLVLVAAANSNSEEPDYGPTTPEREKELQDESKSLKESANTFFILGAVVWGWAVLDATIVENKQSGAVASGPKEGWSVRTNSKANEGQLVYNKRF